MVRPILGIDTASRRGSVAIDGVTPAAFETLAEGGRHAGDLLPVIERLLERAGVIRTDLGGIGVVVGPGSFTGLRIGLATAKGLGFALDIAVEGLSTLEAIARAAALAPEAGGASGLCALIEAGRGEVYAARFALENGSARRLDADAAWAPADLAASLTPDILLAGDAAPRLLTGDPPPFRALRLPALAPAVAAWARSVIPEGARYRPGGPPPNYVRPSDPEAPRRRP